MSISPSGKRRRLAVASGISSSREIAPPSCGFALPVRSVILSL
jgi:hypothetical protein